MTTHDGNTHYENPALEAELAYRRERLERMGRSRAGTGWRRWWPHRRAQAG
jgi:hypothetical protein